MKSVPLPEGATLYAPEFNALRADAQAASWLLAHQQLGALALGTNPSDGQTITFDINGSNVVLTAKATTLANPGDFLIKGTPAETAAVIYAAVINPTTSTANFIGFTGSTANNAVLIQYLGWGYAAGGTTITPYSLNTATRAPLTSFSASTTTSGNTWTANTMALYVEPGTYYVGSTRVLFLGGSTPTFTAPTANPRIDLITADSSGTLAIVEGTESATPSAPTYPLDKIVIAEVYHVVGETALHDNAYQQSGEGYVLNDVRRLLVQGKFISATAAEISGTDSGSANAYAITLTPAPASLTTGMLVQVLDIAHACTGASTLNVNGLGAKTIKKGGNKDLASGDLAAGMNAVLSYDGTYWQLLSPTANINFDGLFSNGVGSPPASASTQTIAHGLGTAPKMVRIKGFGASAFGNNYMISSDGSYNGSTTACVYIADGGSSSASLGVGTSTTYIIVFQTTGTSGCQATISVDATNITLTWSAAGSGPSYAQTGSFEWEAEA